MPKPLATTAGYRKLRADLRREMEHGLKRVEDLLERQKVISYWAIGRRINVYINTREMPPGAMTSNWSALAWLAAHPWCVPGAMRLAGYTWHAQHSLELVTKGLLLGLSTQPLPVAAR